MSGMASSSNFIESCPRCKVSRSFNKSPGFGGIQCNGCDHIWLSAGDMYNERALWLAEMNAGTDQMSIEDMLKEIALRSQRVLIDRIYKQFTDRLDEVIVAKDALIYSGDYARQAGLFNSLRDEFTSLALAIEQLDGVRDAVHGGEIYE